MPERLRGEVARFDFCASRGKVIVAKDKRITAKAHPRPRTRRFQAIAVPEDFIVGRVWRRTSSTLHGRDHRPTPTPRSPRPLLAKLREAGDEESKRCTPTIWTVAPSSPTPLRADETASDRPAGVAIYRMMRPGEPPTEEAVEILFNGLFYSDERYDLSASAA